MQYTDKARIEAYLDRSLTANEVILLETLIEHISQFINDHTGREWLSIEVEDLPSAETRLYDGNGLKELFIDDFSSLEEVNLLDSQGNVVVAITDSDDYVLHPLNEDFKDSIFLRNYTFPDGQAKVSVKAVFSSGEVPSGVIMIATALCSKLIARFTQTSSGFKKESIEGYSYELIAGDDVDKETKNLLNTLDGLKKFNL